MANLAQNPIGLAVASLITISRDKDIEDIKAELDDPDGSKAVMEEAIATLEEKKRYLEYKESEEDR